MKKIKILSHPTQIATIHLDTLEMQENMSDQKNAKMQVRKWRKLRQQ